MQFSLRFFGLLLVISFLFGLANPRVAQALPIPTPTPVISPTPAISPTPSPVSGSVEIVTTDGAGREKRLHSDHGVVPQVGINAGQLVPITLQFAADKAGQPLTVGCLDGGQILGNSFTVLPGGTVPLSFQAGLVFGLYRLLVQLGGEQYLLQFYVVDPNHPRTPRSRSGN